MTNNPDPTAVARWMESINFEWRKPGDGDSSCYWFLKDGTNANWITHEQAAFFYQIMRQTRQKALDEALGAGPEDWNRDNDGYEQGFNQSNNQWRAAIAALKERNSHIYKKHNIL